MQTNKSKKKKKKKKNSSKIYNFIWWHDGLEPVEQKSFRTKWEAWNYLKIFAMYYSEISVRVWWQVVPGCAIYSFEESDVWDSFQEFSL